MFLDRTRKYSNFKRPHIDATLFQIEKCWVTSREIDFSNSVFHAGSIRPVDHPAHVSPRLGIQPLKETDTWLSGARSRGCQGLHSVEVDLHSDQAPAKSSARESEDVQ